MIRIIRSDGEIIVRTSFWETVHDTRKGGSLTTIKLFYGSNKNLLLLPTRCYVDDYDIINESSPEIKIERKRKNNVILLITGQLKNTERKSLGIKYKQTWLYTQNYIKVEHTLIFEKTVSTKKIAVCHFNLIPELDDFTVGPSPWTNLHPQYGEFFGPMEDQTWGKISFNNCPSFEERFVPFDLAVFKKGVEGFQIRPDSDWMKWNEQIVKTRGKGEYAIVGQADPKLIRIIMSPYSEINEPVTLKGKYCFTFYIGIPNISKRVSAKYMEVAIGSNPWPSEEDIKEWACLGVNVLRIHDEYDFVGETDRWWHDWIYPPYDENGMKELDRVINIAHKYGIKIIPYFSLYECYPTSPAFKYVKEWRRTMKYGGHEQYTWSGRMSLFGVLLCPDSNWKKYLLKQLKMIFSKHAFDGVYFDWTTNIPCFNLSHAEGYHSGIDGIYEIMETARKIIGPKGILINHVQGQAMDIIAINFADQIVTLEEKQKHDVYNVEDMPASIRFMNSGSVGIVPNILYPKETDIDPRLRLRQGISRLILLGVFPYSYMRWENKWGYKTPKEAREDPRGIYALFDAFKAINLSEYNFRDCFNSPVKTSVDAVKSAVYWNKKQAVIVLSNTEPNAAMFGWEIDLTFFKWNGHNKFSLVSSKGENWRIVEKKQLRCLNETLGEYGYKVFLLKPHYDNRVYVIHNTRAWKEKWRNKKLIVTTSGPIGQQARLMFYSSVMPKTVSLNKLPLMRKQKWQWNTKTGLGMIEYEYSSPLCEFDISI
ncbi:MAG: glycoside hydrolase family 66 protein [Candidatus Bathyarchaeia archaeon]